MPTHRERIINKYYSNYDHKFNLEEMEKNSWKINANITKQNLLYKE